MKIGTTAAMEMGMDFEQVLYGEADGASTITINRPELYNEVVAHKQLDAEVSRWCGKIVDKSPTAMALAKRSFNVHTEMIRAWSTFARQALALYYDTGESKEGANALREKRTPDFGKYL